MHGIFSKDAMMQRRSPHWRPVIFDVRPQCFFALVFLLFLGACAQEPPQRSPCSDPLGCVWLEPGEPLRIVSMHNLSEVGPDGRELIRGLEMAVMERGARFAGRPIEILSEDEKCSREGGLVAARKIVTDPRIVAVHGPQCSSAAVGAIDLVDQAGMVLVSGSATAPSLTSGNGLPGEHWKPAFFRTAHNDKDQGKAAACFVRRALNVHRAATVHDGDPYTRGLVAAFEKAFVEQGGLITLSARLDKGDMNLRPLLEAVRDSAAELLFFPIFAPEGERLIILADSFEGFERIRLMSADGLFLDSTIETVGEAGRGTFFVVPHEPDGPAYLAYKQRYESVYGTSFAGVFAAHAYDAATLLLHALEQAVFPEADGSLRVERQAIRDALRSTHDFQGLTGPLRCDEFGDCGVPRFKLVRLDEPASGVNATRANILAVLDLSSTSPVTAP